MSELSRQVELGQKATDTDYLDFQRTVNANVKSGARTRQSILLRKLFQREPSFFTALKHTASLAEGMNSTIASRGGLIRDLIATINERYAAKNGNDLFKATNKTATALNSLSAPVKSLDEYKSLIDNLYFIFRESIGQRLGGQVPPTFVDVNDLRTILRHDVDHGKGAKAAAKRQYLGAVFQKYSGAPSPDAIAPVAFPLVQANILASLESDLRALAASLV
ncbi:MAG TPA: hypothetical protein DEA22_11555 [Blastocatellia bacterium]|nr:hypothetical protein [Blastocatellia bacterium]